MKLFVRKEKLALPTSQKALPGRKEKMPVSAIHYVHKNPINFRPGDAGFRPSNDYRSRQPAPAARSISNVFDIKSLPL